MLGDKTHLSDEALVLFSDRELPARRAARVRDHLAQCEPCRARLTLLEDASAGLADLHEQETRGHSALSLNSRNLLKARLSEASARVGKPPAPFGVVLVRQLASACLALLLVAGVVWTARHLAPRRSAPDAISDAIAESTALPRRALTPGSTRAVQVADLCANRALDNDPPVDPSLEQAVFKEYGVPASSKREYELDYLITPALGGAGSIQNLWPQPYSSTWNASAKDQLEDHLHELVCQGKVQLETAQSDLASDWIASYKRYFHTESPLSNAATLDSPSNLGARNPWGEVSMIEFPAL